MRRTRSACARLGPTLAERRARGEHATASALAPELRRRVRAALEPSLRPVLNATGVVLHTNLGRAPLAESALARVRPSRRGYANLELDLATGGRGSRQRTSRRCLRADRRRGRDLRQQRRGRAAARARRAGRRARGRRLARPAGRDRRRLPHPRDRRPARAPVCARSARPTARGAPTTRAQSAPRPARCCCVHPSNYRVVGLHRRRRGARAGAIAHGAASRSWTTSARAPCSRPPSWPASRWRERPCATAATRLLPGDKLLGGPQAGILAGSARRSRDCRRHPLARALRIDKLSLAALEATLRIYRDPQRARAELPVLRAVLEPAEDVRARAELLAARIGGR